MQYVILDLEWNGSYSKKVHRYFNEIIEFGAVKLDENLSLIGTFQAFIKPVVSKKITNLVTNLTGIDEESLEDGCTFPEAVKKFQKFVGKKSVLLTWSTSDLLVLLENCKYFLGGERIPFLERYADAQAYCQMNMEPKYRKQQLGLSSAAEIVGISGDDLSAHRAKDDSLMTARVFRKLYQPETFENFVHEADEEFYERLLFKPRNVTKISDPLVRPEYLVFNCPSCGKQLKHVGKWRYSCKMLCTESECSCGKKYTARVQIREMFDKVSVRKRLSEFVQPEDESANEGTVE